MDEFGVLKNLTILRDGLVKNGESNECVDKLNKWIENIDSPETIKDIYENMQFKKDTHWDYYATTPMFDYLTGYWLNGERNGKDLSAFFPRPDEKEELKGVFENIKAKANHLLKNINSQDEEIKKLQQELSKTLRWHFDRLIGTRCDKDLAASICRMSLHTDEEETLKEIAAFFDINQNEEKITYLLHFTDWLIIKSHWGDLHYKIESICNCAKSAIEDSDK